MSLWKRLRNTFRPDSVDREVSEELEFHRAMLAREEGRTLGNASQWQEETRAMNLWTWLETVLQDVRYGARELARNKGFSTTAVLSLALGIMAATAMYSVIYGVVLEPFPYKDVDNLVSIAIRSPEQRGWRSSYSVDEYAEISRRASVFEGVAASTISDVLWVSNNEPLRLRGNHISANGFDVMGVPALLGRAVTGKEENPETKAVLGYRFWIRQFGGDPSVIGTTLVLNGHSRTIVGIMPPRFMFRGADVYLPVTYRAGETPEGVTSMSVTARRRSGITAAQAETDLDPIVRDLAKLYPARYPPRWKVELITFKETFPSGIRGVLWIMFGAVGLLLLIACANVSNLLLARASARQREIAMRSALGAGRRRLFRQLVTESLLLGITGGFLGVLASWLGLKAIMLVVPPGVIPDEAEVVLNLPVLAFSFGLCLLTAVIFGFAPALHAAGGELANPLKEAGRGAGGSRRMGLLRGSLVVMELSLAIILLSGAGLFLHTLIRLYNAPLAADIQNRLSTRLPLSAQRYPTAERRAVFIGQLLERLSTVPGVLGVGINGGMHPLWSWDFPVDIPGAARPDPRPVNLHQVNAGYLRATGIDLRQGRFLEDADIAARRHVVVVNETFVRRYFPDQAPMGKAVKMWRLKMPPFNLPDDHFEIVGVAQDALHEFQNGEARPEMYIPYSITGLADTLLVHTSGDPMAIAPHVRSQVYQLDGSQFLDQTFTLEAMMDRFVYSRGRFHVWLMGVFATLGLILSVIGVYGLLSQIVSMQQQEYGVRMAIGAGFGDIAGLVLRRGVRLMAFGLAIGVAVTLFLATKFGSLLGVTDPFDPLSIAGACLLLFLSGVVACLIPAWRAGHTNPVHVLR
jgi:putative ABC transport system permease protein